MRNRSGFLKSQAGGILPFIIGILVLAAILVPALLNLSFESVRSAYKGQEEMQRFYAADIGIEDALFKLSDQTTSVPLAYELDDVNGYVPPTGYFFNKPVDEELLREPLHKYCKLIHRWCRCLARNLTRKNRNYSDPLT